MKMMSLRCLISLGLSACYEIIFSVKALNKLSMRIINIPISWVSCEASPDTAGRGCSTCLCPKCTGGAARCCADTPKLARPWRDLSMPPQKTEFLDDAQNVIKI